MTHEAKNAEQPGTKRCNPSRGWLPWAFAALLACDGPGFAQVLTNASFESPALAVNSYVYCSGMDAAQRSIFVWSGTGGAVLQNNSATWGLAAAPEGQQAIAMFGVSSLSQSVYCPTSGVYQLTWRQASRAGDENPIWVQLDGVNVHQFATAETVWRTNTCRLVISTAGSHTVGFAGTAAFQTAGLDKVELAFVPYNQWQRVELNFTGLGSYTNAVNQVELTTRFTGPSNEVYEVLGFWDGTNTWRVRFAPTAPGVWTFSNRCNVADGGLAPRSGSIVVNPATGTNALYQHGGFLQVSPDRRYLTYTDGTPFFWLGDTWWFCPGNLTPFEGGTSTQYVTPSMFKQLVDQRKAQNFSVAVFGFLGSGEINSTEENPRGFMSSGSMLPSYWQGVDRYMDYANEAGLLPVIALSMHDLPYYSSEQWMWLWRYFMARYGSHAVTFHIAGEYQLDNWPTLETNLAKLYNIGAAIKQVDPYKRALTVHPAVYYLDGRQAWSYPWYDFIMFQGGHGGEGTVPPTSQYNAAWNYGKPFVQGELNFEDIWRDTGPAWTTAAGVRRGAYHALQAGAFGYSYGAQGLWYPTQSTNDTTFWTSFGASLPWWQALYFPGSTNMTHLRTCYESVAWWKLQPRPGAVGIQSSTLNVTNGNFGNLTGMTSQGGGWYSGLPAGWSGTASVYAVSSTLGTTPPVCNPSGLGTLRQNVGTLDGNATVTLTFDVPQAFPNGGTLTARITDGIDGLASRAFAAGPSAMRQSVSAYVPAGKEVHVEFEVISGTPGLDNVSVSAMMDPYPDATQPLAKSDGDLHYVVWFPLGSGQNTGMLLNLVATNASGRFAGSWFNLQTGQSTALGGPLAAANGICPLPARPDANDWVLLLNAVCDSNAAPTGASVIPGSRVAVLQWNAALGATNYLVKRAFNSGGPYTSFSSSEATSYTDPNVTNGLTCYYVVSALGACGESPNSSQVSVTPRATLPLVGNPSFEVTVLNAYSTSGWNTLPQPGAWAGGGSAFDTFNGSGQHVTNVPDGTNCCYLAAPGAISQELPWVVSAGQMVRLTFVQGRAASSLGTNASSVAATLFVGGQSWSTNFSDAALAQGTWRTNTFTVIPATTGQLRIAFSNAAGNSFIDSVRLAVAPASPTLSATATGSSLTLTWPVDASGFQLYGASNLVPPVVWVPESAVLQTNQQSISATVPISSGTRFFRLMWP